MAVPGITYGECSTILLTITYAGSSLPPNNNNNSGKSIYPPPPVWTSPPHTAGVGDQSHTEILTVQSTGLGHCARDDVLHLTP